MTPGIHNFSVVRGTSGPHNGLVFQLLAGTPPANLPYEDVRLSIYNRRGSQRFVRATLANGEMVVLDPAINKFAWSPSTQDTRAIPQGIADDGFGKAYYEIEVWNGEYETVYCRGYIEGIGGVNDDIDGTNAGDS